MDKSILAALVLGVAPAAVLYAEETDSLQSRELEQVVVKAVQAPQGAPFAVSRVGRPQLEQFARSGQELPVLLSRTPGVLFSSENGLGTGTVYMRIRGASDSRINVTIDGVPLNSPEDQCVFWANMNSYAALLGHIQVQRGVGSSTTGDGAFGGSVSLATANPAEQAVGRLSGSYGSYGTWNAGASLSSGLLGSHWIADGAWHHTATDGYIHGTAGQSGSYLGRLTWRSTEGRLLLSLKHLGNYEHTGQAWNGVTAGNDDYSLNAYNGVASYADMRRLGLGRFNNLYERFTPDWEGGFSTARHQMSDGSLWPRANDNFSQGHNLLHAIYRPDHLWTFWATLRYTHGSGYYEEFRPNNKLSKFGLAPFTLDEGSELTRTDFVRRKGLTQDTYGMLANVHYSDSLWDVTAGASMQQFGGTHWGRLTYAAQPQLSAFLGLQGGGAWPYYDSHSSKADVQVFAKVSRRLGRDFRAFGDVQYRYVSHLMSGQNDVFGGPPAEGRIPAQRLDIHACHHFLNPKAGLEWQRGPHRAYASYALGHREPDRTSYTDNGSWPAPRPEELHDIEAGYRHTAARWHAGAGLYAMIYRGQLVQTGQQSDIGELLTTNIARSSRLGIELEAGVRLAPWLSLEANAALSRNRIHDFTEVVDTYDASWTPLAPTQVHYAHSSLAFSPWAIVNGFADFCLGRFSAQWHTAVVSRQYMDNTRSLARSLPRYSQTNVSLGYKLGDLQLGLQLNNIFNSHHATGGWVYSCIVGDEFPQAHRYHQVGYIPTAGFTAMASARLQFNIFKRSAE